MKNFRKICAKIKSIKSNEMLQIIFQKCNLPNTQIASATMKCNYRSEKQLKYMYIKHLQRRAS